MHKSEMSIWQELPIQKLIMKALFFKVPSKSEAGKKYLVRKDIYGRWGCECPRFVFKRNCLHIEAVQELIIETNGALINKSDSSAINKGVVGPLMGSQQVV